MTEAVDIRPYSKTLASEVERVARAALHRTYSGIFTPDDIDAFLARNYSPSALEKSVRGGRGGSWFEVAVQQTSVVGFAHIGDRGSGWELVRIYVHPECLGKGIGYGLLTAGEAFLRSRGAHEYFSYVHPKSDLGIRFYGRQGFTHIAGADKHDEWFMHKSLAGTNGSPR
jgi:GNAT superfamily N-acetyltransferase